MKLWSALTELWTTTERFSASCVGLYSWNGKLNLRDLMKRNPSDACSEIKTLFFPLRAHVGIRKNLCFCVTTAATLCFGLNECFYTSELICREKFSDNFFFHVVFFWQVAKFFAMNISFNHWDSWFSMKCSLRRLLSQAKLINSFEISY